MQHNREPEAIPPTPFIMQQRTVIPTSKPLASTFALKGSKYLGMDYDDIDCQALVEAMLRDVGVKQNWRGSNAMYRDMAWVGTPEECVAKFGRVPVGALIYILEATGAPDIYKDDVGNASHVGVKTGVGLGAIHSSESKGGVVESKFANKTIRNGGWNRVGICKLLDYGSDIEEALYGQKEAVRTQEKARVKTQGGDLNLRAAPDLGSARVGRIPNGAIVDVLGKSVEWWSVSYGGEVGYASASYLMPTDGPTEEVTVTLTREAAEVLLAALKAASVGGGG